MTRIALIHAVQVAMQPIEDAFQRLWPEVERVNLLDDALSVDRAKSEDLSPAMSQRISDLAHYVSALDAAAILYTCSAFGPAIETVARGAKIPILKPNEAMFEAALARGNNIGMVATFGPSVASMEQEFREAAAGRLDAKIKTICVPDAMAASRRGDHDTHNSIVAEAAKSLAGCDAIMLAQFSTSRAAKAVRAVTPQPVLTSPDAAVVKLKSLLNKK